jgi:hypothetical protein
MVKYKSSDANIKQKKSTQEHDMYRGIRTFQAWLRFFKFTEWNYE